LITQFSDCRYVDPFQRYLRSKSKVVRNRAEFFMFFALPNFVGGDPFQKLYPRYHGYFSARRLVKFHEVIATSPNVIGVNALEL